MTPTKRTFGKSSPLAIICVPRRICTIPSRVTLTTRRAGLDPAHGVRWESTGEGSYTLETVPHAGRAESLNVAMAATVVVFEVRRQRQGR